MTTWIVILSIGLGTYALRLSMFVLLGRHRLPGWTATPMALVAPAAVAALVTSTLAVRGGALTMPALADVAAVAAGFVAVRRSGNVMHGFAAGMPVFWAVTALGW
jgi:branched-subunit amino acid transport protein